MSEIPQLINLSETALAVYSNVPVATAVVANTRPQLLTDSIKQVGEDDSVLAELEDAANHAYDIAVDRSNEPNTSLSLPGAAQTVVDAQNLRDGHQSSVELAGEINVLRRKLSKPIRVAATILSATVVLATADATLHQVRSSRQNDAESIIEIVVEDIAMGIGLGTLVSINSHDNRLVGSEARRRARRIAKRQK